MKLRERMNYCSLCLKQDTKLGSVEETNGTGLVFKATIITHIIHDFSIFCLSTDVVLCTVMELLFPFLRSFMALRTEDVLPYTHCKWMLSYVKE